MKFLQYITFVSNDDSLDWKENATPDSICQRVTNKVKNGDGTAEFVSKAIEYYTNY